MIGKKKGVESIKEKRQKRGCIRGENERLSCGVKENGRRKQKG